MQKLASRAGYVGLQKAGAGVNAANRGQTDPKEVIAVVNKTLTAVLELDDGKPEKADPRAAPGASLRNRPSTLRSMEWALR